MPLFDAYLFVDWSAAGQPGPRHGRRDQIWIGERMRGGVRASETYCRTRHEAVGHLVGRLRAHGTAARRVLVGCDFAYGYPAGFAAALGLGAGLPPWRAIWRDIGRRISDSDDNANNRFEVAGALNVAVRMAGHPGPFWGRPERSDVPGLPRTSPGYPCPTARGPRLAKFRRTEVRAGSRIFSPWQMCHTGSVGGQTLTGIPRLAGLRDHPEFAAWSAVWPFETGFTPTPTPAAGPFFVHAEIWPSIARQRVAELTCARPGLIKDQAQVRVLCAWAESLDRADELGPFFATPAALPADAARTCITEEGWILGVR
jgi:precorrin-8X/cobalt-precorrin-8 methylmutase